MLILLLPFLLIMHDFSQLPDEFCQSLHVVVPPFQQLIAKTRDVLFDLLQFTCGLNRIKGGFISQGLTHGKHCIQKTC